MASFSTSRQQERERIKREREGEGESEGNRPFLFRLVVSIGPVFCRSRLVGAGCWSCSSCARARKGCHHGVARVRYPEVSDIERKTPTAQQQQCSYESKR